MNSTKIKLSKKDLEKGLKLPTKLTRDLAYIVGVLAGDGNIFVRENKHDYRIKCVGNPKDEKEFYKNILSPIFKKVFNINLDIRLQDSGTTYGFYIYSKALVEYLTTIFELPKGKKYNKLKVPRIIRKNKLVVHFIRGLADTDFCVTYKKKNPAIIGASNSKKFMKEISIELKKMGFNFYEVYDYRLNDSRFKKGYSLINRIEINGWRHLDLWMRKIGFNSSKHLAKINKQKI